MLTIIIILLLVLMVILSQALIFCLVIITNKHTDRLSGFLIRIEEHLIQTHKKMRFRSSKKPIRIKGWDVIDKKNKPE